jgi:hypothetical protein
MPDVSVIIPTYNRSALLAQAVRSVLAQTYDDFEIVVVDDGSTDDTRSVIESFGDPRIVYVWQENQQRCAARNNGISQARGRYVGFLDSDDVWFPDKLQKQIEAFGKYPQVGVVYCNHVRIAGDNTFPNPVEFLRTADDEVGNVHKELLVLDIVQMGTPVVKKELLDKVGGFDTSLPHAEDWDMWIRLSAHADFCRVGLPLMAYRTHAGMRTSSPLTTQKGDLIIINKHLGDGSDESNALRTRAEMLSYGRRAFQAAMCGLPERDAWLQEAQTRAAALGEPGAVGEWVTSVAMTNLTPNLTERVELARLLRESLEVLVSTGGATSVAQSMQRFWRSCVWQDYMLKDYPAVLRTAMHTLTHIRPSRAQLRIAYTAGRALGGMLTERRTKRIVPQMERRLQEILGPPAI